MPNLLWSRRWMLNRLSMAPSDIHSLVGPGSDMVHTRACLAHLEELDLAQRNDGAGWSITDAGIIAMAANGVIYAEDAGR